MKRTLLCAVAALLCLPLLTSPTLAASDDGGLPPGCRAALLAEKTYLDANRETLHPADAILRLQANAGPPCGFDLTGATPTTTDPEAMAAFLASIGGGRNDGPNEPDEVIGPLQEARLELTPQSCAVPGSGLGAMTTYILGTELRSFVADGEWRAPAKDTVSVDGTSGIFSGTQLDAGAGTVFVAAVPILGTDGEADATCVKVTTTEVVGVVCTTSYEYRIISWELKQECEQKLKTETKLYPCAATADQWGVLDLVLVYHEYEVADPPEGC